MSCGRIRGRAVWPSTVSEWRRDVQAPGRFSPIAPSCCSCSKVVTAVRELSAIASLSSRSLTCSAVSVLTSCHNLRLQSSQGLN